MRISSILPVFIAVLVLGFAGCKTRSPYASSSWSLSKLNPFSKSVDTSSTYPTPPSQLTEPSISMPPPGNYSQDRSPAPDYGIRNVQVSQSPPFGLSDKNRQVTTPQQGMYNLGAGYNGPKTASPDRSDFRVADQRMEPVPTVGPIVMPPSDTISDIPPNSGGLGDYQRGIGSQNSLPSPGLTNPYPENGNFPPTNYANTNSSTNSIPSPSEKFAFDSNRPPLGSTNYQPGITPNPPGQLDYQPGQPGQPGQTGYPNNTQYQPKSNITQPAGGVFPVNDGGFVTPASGTSPTSNTNPMDISPKWRPGNTGEWHPDSTSIDFPPKSGDLKYPLSTG